MIKALKHTQIKLLACLFILVQCQSSEQNISPESFEDTNQEMPEQYIIVLGTAQDAGYPQANCNKSCCNELWDNRAPKKLVSCLGLVDKKHKDYWIFDATPDFKWQIDRIQKQSKLNNQLPSGIFLTHAHVGHYTGLMHLGREIIGANEVPVHVMPVMKDYLTNNGPWSQLVTLNNIQLLELKKDSVSTLNDNLQVIPYQVPHRDEYSETVGFSIRGKNKKVLFIPDIDKWQKWDKNIIEEVKKHDVSYIDGSFFNGEEMPNRDMSEIPHPFLIESMELFKDLNKEEKSSIHFIHFNHTNPVLREDSKAYKEVIKMGFNIAYENEIIGL